MLKVAEKVVVMIFWGASDSVVFVDPVVYDVDVRVYSFGNVVPVIGHFTKDGKALARRPRHEI